MQMFTDLLRSFLPNLSLEGVGHVSVGLISCGTLLYSWHVLRPQPPGWTRLLSATPVVLANVAAPFVYRACINGQYCNNSILYIAFLTWWTNSKVLTLCMDRGPLPASKSLPRFIASMFLPINIRDEPSKITKDDKNTSTNDIYRSPFARVSNRYVQFVAKVMAMSALAYATHRFWNDMTPFQWDVCLTFIMYLNLCFQLDMFALIASTFCGVQLEPGMNEPYLSSSLSEFWGKRWNLTASRTLRHLIYDPISQNQLVSSSSSSSSSSTSSSSSRPSAGRRAAGLMASFLVSGIVHEFIIWFATGGRYLTFEWLAFFLVNGAACCGEGWLKHQWRRRGWRRFPRIVAVSLTLAFLIGHASIDAVRAAVYGDGAHIYGGDGADMYGGSTAEWLFYPPVIRSGWSTAGVDKLRLQLVWAGIIPDSDAMAV